MTPDMPLEEIRAYHDERTRRFCNVLLFWDLCPEKSCRRARACVGDARACWNRHWWSFTEDERQWFRHWLKAVLHGKTPEEAAAFADAERERAAARAHILTGRPPPADGNPSPADR